MLIIPEKLFTYYKYLARGFVISLIFWAAMLIVTRLGYYMWFPMSQKIFIELFEVTRPDGISFLQFAMPTIIFLAFSWVVIDIAAIGSDWAERVWKIGIRNKSSIILNKYVHSQSLSFWEGRLSGKVNAQIGTIADGFFAMAGLVRIGIQLLVTMLSAGMLLTVNTHVMFIVFGVLILRTIYSAVMIFPMERAAEVASHSGSTLSGRLVDSISNYSLVKMFGSGKLEERHLMIHRRRAIRDTVKLHFIQRLFWALPAILWDIMFALVMMMCVMLYSRGEMQLSDIVFSMSMYFSLMTSISDMMSGVPGIVDGLGAGTKAYSELFAPLELTDAKNATPLEVLSGRITIENLSFQYHDKQVLNNITLEILPGETIGIIGESGAGKTTLMAIMLRLYDPCNGRILIDKQDIRHVTRESLMHNVSIIPQDTGMFNRSIRDNITYGRPDATMDQVRRAAKIAGADDFIMKTEKGYATIVGEHGVKLSGGQRQRIAIARAILKDAPILILDEATSALDSDTESMITESLRQIAGNKTVIVVSHRLATLKNMDRIAVIENGRIAEIGTPHELMKKRGGIYRHLLDMQSV